MVTENKNIPSTDLGGGVTRKVLSYSQNLMACELRMEKGAVGALHAHPHEQIGYVVSGTFELLMGSPDNKRIITAGDTYYTAPNEPHGVVALTDGILLDVFTPQREDFLK